MDVPPTPGELKKYRKSHVNQPGEIQKHWGLADDAPRFPKTYSYGKSTNDSDKAADLMKGTMLEGMADRFNEIKE